MGTSSLPALNPEVEDTVVAMGEVVEVVEEGGDGEVMALVIVVVGAAIGSSLLPVIQRPKGKSTVHGFIYIIERKFRVPSSRPFFPPWLGDISATVC